MKNLRSNALMIIDDDSDDRTIFMESVSKVNTELLCMQAANGHDGLRMLLHASVLPAYVFVDVNMPDMSGFDLLRRIRREPTLKDVKVIIYTTSNQRSAMETARALGADGFFTKPEDVADLVNYLSDLVRTGVARPFIEVGVLALLASVLGLFS